jgi:hypothetical protein
MNFNKGDMRKIKSKFGMLGLWKVMYLNASDIHFSNNLYGPGYAIGVLSGGNSIFLYNSSIRGDLINSGSSIFNFPNTKVILLSNITFSNIHYDVNQT